MRKYGAASSPVPATHCQLPALEARSPSIRWSPEPALAAPPVDQQMLDEEARADHPHAVRQEALGRQLPHAGVDQTESGLAPAPGLEVAVVVAPRDRARTGASTACSARSGWRCSTNRNQSRHSSSARHLAAPASSASATRRRGDTRRGAAAATGATWRRDRPAGRGRRRTAPARRARTRGRRRGGSNATGGRVDPDPADRPHVGRVRARPPDQLVRHADVVGVQHQPLAERRRDAGVPAAGERRQVLGGVDGDRADGVGVPEHLLLARAGQHLEALAASRRAARGGPRRPRSGAARAARAAAAGRRRTRGGPVRRAVARAPPASGCRRRAGRAGTRR